MGSHGPPATVVARTEGGTDKGQSVPRSLRESCRVAPESGTIVETSSRSRATIVLVAEGPVRPAESYPYMVLMIMYTDGDVLGIRY